MRRLYQTSRSPYARKVQLVFRRKGLPFDVVAVDLANRSPEFSGVSPIGKVPVLVEDDGLVVYDSTVICEYLEDRYPQPSVMLPGWEGRLAVRTAEELGDSLADQAIAVFFGRQAQNTAAVVKGEQVAGRILDTLEAAAPVGPWLGTWSIADAAILSGLGYMGFRLGDTWRDGRPKLSTWFDAADAAPDAVATRPRA